MYELYLVVQSVFLLFLVQCTFRSEFRKHETNFHGLVHMPNFLHEDWIYLQKEMACFWCENNTLCVKRQVHDGLCVHREIGHEIHQLWGCIQAGMWYHRESSVETLWEINGGSASKDSTFWPLRFCSDHSADFPTAFHTVHPRQLA